MKQEQQKVDILILCYSLSQHTDNSSSNVTGEKNSNLKLVRFHNIRPNYTFARSNEENKHHMRCWWQISHHIDMIVSCRNALVLWHIITKKGIWEAKLHTSAGTCLASTISALLPARAIIVFGFPVQKEVYTCTSWTIKKTDTMSYSAIKLLSLLIRELCRWSSSCTKSI